MNLHHESFFEWPALCTCFVRTSAWANGWLQGDGPAPVGYSDQDVDLEVLEGEDIIYWTDAPLFVTASDDGEDEG